MSNFDETEADTRAERIDPVLATAGWGQNGSRIRRELICPDRILLFGELYDFRQALLQKTFAAELT